MIQHLKSRRNVAGRTRLLAVAALCLGLIVTAHAQRPGGAHGSPMGSPPMGMSTPRGDLAPRGDLGPRSFSRPLSGARAQPRMGLQLGLGGRWWDDHHTARKLSLTSDQQRRMDAIFDANEPALTTAYSNLQREEINLASLSSSDLKDESKVFAAIDRVSHARNDLEKEYAHVLLQVRQQLDPQQLDALNREIANSRQP